MKAYSNVRSFLFSFFISASFCGIVQSCSQVGLVPFPVQSLGQETSADSSILLSLHADSNKERTVLYEIPVPSRYELFGSFNNGEIESLGSWSDLSKASVRVYKGKWSFRLDAFDIDDKLILSGSLKDQIVSVPSALEFFLETVQKGVGSVNVTLKYPENAGIACISAYLLNNSLTTVREQSYDVLGLCNTTFEKDSIDAGNYILVFKFRDADSNLLGSVSEAVRVRSNLTSRKTIDLTGKIFNGPPSIPKNLSASLEHLVDFELYDYITIEWDDDSVNEQRFEIDILSSDSEISKTLSVSEDPYYPKFTRAGSHCSCDFFASRGTTQRIRIRAVNAFGSSDWSDEVIVYVPYLVKFSFYNLGNEIHETSPEGFISPIAFPTNSDSSSFAGWSTNQFGSIPWDFVNIPFTQNTVLYPLWTYDVHFMPNGGEGVMPDIQVYKNVETPLPPNSFIRDGYKFVGWSLSPKGMIKYVNEASVNGANEKTLYACWCRIDANPAEDFVLFDGYINWDVTGYTGTASEVVIPSYINGKPVIRVSITENDVIKSVVLPDTMDTLHSRSFYCCDYLATITLPPTLNTIDQDAIYSCRVTSLYIPASVTRTVAPIIRGYHSPSAFEVAEDNEVYCAEDGAIYSKDRKTLVNYPPSKTDIVFYPGVTVIGSNAFDGCNKCFGQSVSLPDSVVRIEYRAFACYLDTVVLPASIVEIEDCAFEGNLLKSIVVDPGNVSFTAVDGVLYDRDLRTLLVYPANKGDTSFVIPDSVVRIGSHAFSRQGYLNSLTIPSSVTEIDYNGVSFDVQSIAIIIKSTTPPSLLKYSGITFSYKTELYVPSSTDHSLLNAYLAEPCFSEDVDKIFEMP